MDPVESSFAWNEEHLCMESRAAGVFALGGMKSSFGIKSSFAWNEEQLDFLLCLESRAALDGIKRSWRLLIFNFVMERTKSIFGWPRAAGGARFVYLHEPASC